QTLEAAAMRLAFERRRTDLLSGLSDVVSEMKTARETSDVRRYLATDTAYHHVLSGCCDSPLITEAKERYGDKIAALRNHHALNPSTPFPPLWSMSRWAIGSPPPKLTMRCWCLTAISSGPKRPMPPGSRISQRQDRDAEAAGATVS